VAVREGILALLAGGPRHGYDLRSEFEDRTAKLWNLNSGQVYTTLDRLVRDGLVETAGSGEDDRRRPYRITPAGRQELDRWLDASTWTVDPPRDELLMKILLVADDVDRAPKVIATHRHALLGQLQRLRAEQRQAGAHRPLAAHLAADALVARLESDLHWLDRCEQRFARRTEAP
jgi:DNA-binding PadR family transcriptional regulator